MNAILLLEYAENKLIPPSLFYELRSRFVLLMGISVFIVITSNLRYDG